MKRRLTILLLILTVGAGGWFAYRQLHAARSKNLELYGNVDIREVNLGFRVGGRIQEMRVEEGDVVRAGDVVALLDQGPYQDQVNIARAQLEQAQASFNKVASGYRKEEIEQARAQTAQMQANLTNADLNFKRQSALGQTNVISKQDLDN